MKKLKAQSNHADLKKYLWKSQKTQGHHMKISKIIYTQIVVIDGLSERHIRYKD